MNNQLFQQARSAYAQKDYQGALEAYQQCLQDAANPVAPGEAGQLHHQIGNCLVKLDDYNEAIHAYTQATADSTYDAVGAVTRLIDMGMESFLVASALYGVLSQRLVRKICTACNGSGSDAAGNKCRRCNGTGFKGRSGIFELLRMNDEIRQAVNRNVPSSELERLAVAAGMVTLREDGLAKVKAGITTAEELARSTAEQ